MYKKYVRLKLNESKKTICRIRYDEYGSQVEVKLFSEEEVDVCIDSIKTILSDLRQGEDLI